MNNLRAITNYDEVPYILSHKLAIFPFHYCTLNTSIQELDEIKHSLLNADPLARERSFFISLSLRFVDE